MSDYTLSINNETIWRFYNKYTSVNFETMNLLLVDMLSKVLSDNNSTLNSSVITQLMEHIKTLQSQMNSMSDNITHMRNENTTNISIKLAEFRKEYIEDMKTIFTNNISEKISPLLKEQLTHMLDKTHLLFNDIVPKNNDQLNKLVNDSLKSLHYSISEDTNKFLSSTINAKTLQDFIYNIEQKIISNEQRIDNSIRDIKNSNDKLIELTSSNQQNTVALTSTVSDIVKKMENSSSKGKYSENILFNILTNLYPSAQVVSVGTQKETGDIMIIRNNKPTILVENKNWDRNVLPDEVKKFIHDIETQNCCGLFISQHTGISNKKNFEINIHDGKTLLYLHEVKYDAERIKVAIDIIDHFQERLDTFEDKSDSDVISKELLNEINKEYQEYCSQKLNIIKTIKDFSQKLHKQVEEINLPNLDKYLSAKFSFSIGTMVCDYCQFIAKNQQALSAHQRGCKSKKDVLNINTIETNVVIPPTNNKVLKKSTKEMKL